MYNKALHNLYKYGNFKYSSYLYVYNKALHNLYKYGNFKLHIHLHCIH